MRIRWLLVCVLLLATGAVSTGLAEIHVERTQLTEGICSGRFIRHELDHRTSVNQQPIRMFDSNGSGLAINDLNNDGRLDLIFANLDGAETILWNEGGLRFRTQELDLPPRTRAVAAVDVDADGWMDLVFTSQRAAPSWWRNQQDGTFRLHVLPGVTSLAYALNWADLDGDGDLDLVTGSYNAELDQIMTNQTLFGVNHGIIAYENRDGQFIATRLSDRSQALAIALVDLNGDVLPEVAVGNDFSEPDRFWTQSGALWQEIEPFQITTYSTMSFDIADLDNDGSSEFFATDMQPYKRDPETLLAWQPVLDDLEAIPLLPDDPQVISNVLLKADRSVNHAQTLGIAATGWSWSAKFGDLDADGYLDLYVVNGMIALDLFGHLPEDELVEENQVFRNQQGQMFHSMPEWALNATESGRGMSMADLDGDGDLDIVINNLSAPALLFENQLCGGNQILIRLRQPGTNNPFAIGAKLVLHTSSGSYQRDIRAISGYLSGDPAEAHFGIPADDRDLTLEILWPDGTKSHIDQLDINHQHTITRISG